MKYKKTENDLILSFSFMFSADYFIVIAFIAFLAYLLSRLRFILLSLYKLQILYFKAWIVVNLLLSWAVGLGPNFYVPPFPPIEFFSVFVWQMCGWRMTCGSQFSIFIIWINRWAISLALFLKNQLCVCAQRMACRNWLCFHHVD